MESIDNAGSSPGQGLERVGDAGTDLEQIAEQLIARANDESVPLTGADGLLTALTQRVLSAALEEEIADHLGYDKHDLLGHDSENR